MKIVFFLLLISSFSFAQVNRNDTIRVKNLPKDSISTKSIKEVDVIADIEKANAPLSQPKFSPTKAGLYSAVLPGLGQYYNKKYWKIPIVLGGIGTGVGFTLYFDKSYRRYRDAFVAEINGVEHEFSSNANVTKEVLGNFQDQQKRSRDYAIAITSLVYILNIVDAVVDAHLYEGRNDPDLSFSPTIINDGFGFENTKAGIALNFKF